MQRSTECMTLVIYTMACGRVCFSSMIYAVFLLVVVGSKYNTTKKVGQGKEERIYLDKIVIRWLGNGFSAPNTLSTGFIERVNENLTSTSCMLIKPAWSAHNSKRPKKKQ